MQMPVRRALSAGSRNSGRRHWLNEIACEWMEDCMMKECENNDTRGVEFVGMRPLKVIKIRRLLSGKESVSYNFSPSTHGVPDEFLIIPDVAWRDGGVDDLNDAVRRYVESLRENGKTVEVAVSDSGIVCIDLLFNGERRSLWFNAYTSDTVILDADGNVCKNIREAIQGSSV